jgi:serine/threonine protein phosphatase 1
MRNDFSAVAVAAVSARSTGMWARLAKRFFAHTLHDTRDRHLTLPDGDRVIYAIGDVHGCFDQLLQLESLIVEDARRYGDRAKTIAVLGDFIDRGPQSAQVIAHLMAPPPQSFSRIALAGNHESAMLAFLDDPAARRSWLSTGGLETLASYNVPVRIGVTTRQNSRRLAKSALAFIPGDHLDFIRNLPLSVAWGKYLFVHACPSASRRAKRGGGRPPTAGVVTELLDHRAVVVHGHALSNAPENCGDRIGVDIGAYARGRLACVRLDGQTVEFLVTPEAKRSLSD